MTAKNKTLLLVVDVQPDFLPGGALAVPHGDAIVAPLARLMQADRFDHIMATQDWHPAGHVSFASSHAAREPFETIPLYGHEQVLWPDHCVIGSPGAALAAGLPWDRVGVFIRKGTDPAVDSYSGFRNNWNAAGERPSTGLTGLLRELGVGTVYLAGLARDYCVKWSAEDAAAAGFRSIVLWDLTRPVDPDSDAAVRESLTGSGVEIADSKDCLLT